MQKKYYLGSILLWLGGLILLTAFDYALRLVTENDTSLGMNSTIWYLLQIFIGISSLGLLVQAVKQMPTHKAVLLSGTTIILGLLVYLMMIWLYVLGTGIDSV